MTDRIPAETSQGGTLPKIVRILGFFADHGTDWRIRELAEELGIARSTVHRVCQLMVGESLLSYDSTTDRYYWGPELVRIAHAVHSSTDLDRLAQPILEEIVRNVSETALVTSYDYARHAIVFTSQVECQRAVRYHTEMGVPLPPHAGASGKSILAFVDDTELDNVLAAGLTRATPQTTTDAARLNVELGAIRQQGWAVSHGERTPEAVGHACPIFDGSGRVLGSLCVTVPEYRHEAELQNRIVSTLMSASERLSRLLGLPAALGYPPGTAGEAPGSRSPSAHRGTPPAGD